MVDHSRPGARAHLDRDQRSIVRLNRRHFLLAGLAATVTAGYASYSSSQSSSGDDSALPDPSHSTGPSTTTGRNDRAAVASPTSSTTTTTVAELAGDLVPGMVGAEVEAVQSALAALRFDPGPIDGIFGDVTLSAVWAFEKIVLGTPRTEMRGAVTPTMWLQMNEEFRITPRRTPGGTHMEVYLPEQVSVLFVDGDVRVISHVSSGEGVEWCDVVEIDLDDGTTEEQGICGISVTPGGVYQFDRKIEGWRNAKLGRLYQPIYFNYGIAIHGALDVPEFPASRGCVRHPMHVAEYLPDLIELGDMIYVFDGVEEPETYGAQPMIFDYPDPNWVPPTTTSTTTTTTSTTTTTQPAPTTSQPTPPPTNPSTTTSSPTTTTSSPTTTSSTLAAG